MAVLVDRRYDHRYRLLQLVKNAQFIQRPYAIVITLLARSRSSHYCQSQLKLQHRSETHVRARTVFVTDSTGVQNVSAASCDQMPTNKAA